MLRQRVLVGSATRRYHRAWPHAAASIDTSCLGVTLPEQGLFPKRINICNQDPEEPRKGQDTP
ncbi:hypothetical protein QMZ05_08050 [Bradyrhizobium sp. INPA03-11B]|uniref:hypothetical protein n=1 Tax=Bradyrhizobium sp. INPA03-11B TaxID=418598 RepID=UPI00338FF0DC